MALKLGPGEQVVFEGHPSWRSIFGFYLKGVLIVGVLVALVVLWGEIVGDGAGTASLALVLFGGSAIVALVGFLRRAATRYTITNRRLRVKRGVLSRDVQEARIERVQDVSYRQSPWQRLLQIGEIDFDTGAHDPEDDLTFTGVSQPAKVVARVHRAAELRGLPPSRQSV